MMEVAIKDAELQQAASTGMDEFVGAVVQAIRKDIDNQLTAETMAQLSAEQTTLLAWQMMHDELMDGGWVQLIHNGLGPFVFKNPLAKALKLWGLRALSKQIYAAHTLYTKYGSEIERDCTDEEFMALFERFPEFDDLDDEFVENEEQWTAEIAHYVDEHLGQFVVVKD